MPLNIPIKPMNPARKPLVHRINAKPLSNDDMLELNTQSSSHWDGLRHVGYLKAGERKFYNGTKQDEISGPNPSTKLGVHSRLSSKHILRAICRNWRYHLLITACQIFLVRPSQAGAFSSIIAAGPTPTTSPTPASRRIEFPSKTCLPVLILKTPLSPRVIFYLYGLAGLLSTLSSRWTNRLLLLSETVVLSLEWQIHWNLHAGTGKMSLQLSLATPMRMRPGHLI